MNHEPETKQRLLKVLQASQIPINEDLDWNKEFAELGIALDSIGQLQLTIGIENEFDFEVMPEHMKSGIFFSPAALLSYIQSQLADHSDAL